MVGIKEIQEFDWSQVHVTEDDFKCELPPRVRKPTDAYQVIQDPKGRAGQDDEGIEQPGIGWVVMNPFKEIYGEDEDWIYATEEGAWEMADYLNQQQDYWAEDARKES